MKHSHAGRIWKKYSERQLVFLCYYLFLVAWKYLLFAKSFKNNFFFLQEMEAVFGTCTVMLQSQLVGGNNWLIVDFVSQIHKLLSKLTFWSFLDFHRFFCLFFPSRSCPNLFCSILFFPFLSFFLFQQTEAIYEKETMLAVWERFHLQVHRVEYMVISVNHRKLQYFPLT